MILNRFLTFPQIFSCNLLVEALELLIQTPKMGDKSLHNINVLCKRLKEASKQAGILQREISDIQQQIHIIKKAEIFKNHFEVGSNIGDGVDFYSSSSSSTSKRSANFEPNDSNSKKLKLDFTTEGDYVVVFTDGACENNGQKNAKAGIGVWFGENHILNISEPVDGRATNNTAEIQACIEAIKTAKENGIRKLKIKTDSQFTINCMTKWIDTWKKKNWKLAGGGDVKNQVDLKKLDELCKTLDIKWEHVNGHVGIKGNEEADKLAKSGAMRYRS